MQAAPATAPSRFDLASVDAMLDSHPEDAARRIGGRSISLVHGENDDTAIIEGVEPVFANAPGPKGWITIPDADRNHLDARPGLARVITLAVDWFSEHLVRVECPGSETVAG